MVHKRWCKLLHCAGGQLSDFHQHSVVNLSVNMRLVMYTCYYVCDKIIAICWTYIAAATGVLKSSKMKFKLIKINFFSTIACLMKY